MTSLLHPTGKKPSERYKLVVLPTPTGTKSKWAGKPRKPICAPVLVRPWHPRPDQKVAMKFLLENAVAGLLLDPGLGKTSIVLGAIRELKREGMFERALVIAPRRVCHNVWPAEASEWEQFTGLRVRILHGVPDRKRDEVLGEQADLFVINPEGLPWLMTPERMRKLAPCTLVVDESSKFKNTQTQRFRLLKPYLQRFTRRWILTGSPMPNGYIDLFGQMYILDLGYSLGQFITHYRNRYFYPTGYGGYEWKLKPELTVDRRTFLPADETTPSKEQIVTTAEKAIQKRVAPFALRMETEGHVKMPERFDNVIRVDLEPKIRKLYDEMEEEMIVRLESGTDVRALSAAAASNKCSQIANGGLYFEKWTENSDEEAILKKGFENLHDTKTEAVVDLIEEASGVPCVVGYDFHHDLSRLLVALGKNTPVLGGKTTDRRASEIIAAWNRKEVPVLLVQPSSMGHGLNLQRGGYHLIFHSLIWDYEIYDQFIRRFWRAGADYLRFFVHHVVARDTVDEAKMRGLSRKAKNQDGFMTALREYACKRQHAKVT